eukprot:1105_1
MQNMKVEIKYTDPLEEYINQGRFLGRGGEGFVIEAESADGEKKVAIKITPLPDPKFVTRSERTIAGYKKLCSEAGSLNNINIPLSIHRFQTQNTKMMGEVQIRFNMDLDRFIETQSGPMLHCNDKYFRRCKKYICGINCGLIQLHGCNLVHRDLKAKNILINSQGAKIADMGFILDVADNPIHTNSVRGSRLQLMEIRALGLILFNEELPINVKDHDIYEMICVTLHMVIGKSNFRLLFDKFVENP